MKQLNTVDQLKFDFYTADAIVSNLLAIGCDVYNIGARHSGNTT